jgi:type I site-specific restriction endonuclease
MANDTDKMSEEDIRTLVIVPKLMARGWKAIAHKHIH